MQMQMQMERKLNLTQKPGFEDQHIYGERTVYTKGKKRGRSYPLLPASQLRQLSIR
jgi:hypothetical protein